MRHRSVSRLAWLVALVCLDALYEGPIDAQSIACPAGMPANTDCVAWAYHPWQYWFYPWFGPVSMHPDLGSAQAAARQYLSTASCDATFTGTSSTDCLQGGFCYSWGNEPIILRMSHEYICAGDPELPESGARIDHRRVLTGVPSPQSDAQCPPGYSPAGERVSLIGDPPAVVTHDATYACWRLAIVEQSMTQRHDANGCLSKGNPCDVLVGNKRQTEIDYAAAPGAMSFKRTYNSLGYHPAKQAPHGKPLGEKWFASYLQYVSATADLSSSVVHAVRPDGDVIAFMATIPGSASTLYRAEGEIKDRLVVVTNTSGAFAGWRYITANDDEELFDSSGRLLAITTHAGITHALTYGSNGRVVSVVDDFGHELSFQWDAAAPPRLASVALPGGSGSVAFAYGAANNLTHVTYPDNRSRRYFYELTGAGQQNLLTGIEDEAGVRYATWEYSADNVVTSSAHAGGADRYTISYDADGSRVVIDPLGTRRTYSTALIAGQRRYTGSDVLCQGCNEYASATFDAFGNFQSTVDFNGIGTRYTHDTERTLELSRTEAYGTPRARTISTSWHATYRLPALIDEPGRLTTFTYDGDGNLLQRETTDKETREVRRIAWTYDRYGRVLSEDGPRTDVADVTTYSYYSCGTGYHCGQLQTVTNALYQVTTYDSYNAHGQPLQITDPNRVMTTLTYDARQRLTGRTVGGEQTTFEYWPTGLLKKVVLPDRSFVHYTYDDAHRLMRLDDADGNYVVYTLDGMGNRTAEDTYDPTNLLRRRHSRVFNDLNQLGQDLTAAGTLQQATLFGYDANGNEATVEAAMGRDTVGVHDELNRLVEITDAAYGLTRLRYDAGDNLTAVTDPLGNVTSYVYNGFDELTAQTSPDTGVTANTYDSAGNLAASTDARGAMSRYVYDSLNRVTSAAYGRNGATDQRVSFTYDAGAHGVGRRTGARDADHSMAWAYDAQGRVVLKTQTVGTVATTVAYTYTDGNLSTVTTPSGQTVAYEYDRNARVTSIAVNGATLLSGVTYEPFGPVNGWTWGNGAAAHRTFDTDGNVTEIASGGDVKSYAYDDALRIVRISDTLNPARSNVFGYDSLDRLTSAATSTATRGWIYDANGNRLSETGESPATYTIGTGNRLASISGGVERTYTYSAVGSIQTYGDVAVTYNEHGRMKAFTKGSSTARFVYNALDQRVRRSGGGASPVYYVYDEAGHLLGEYNARGGLVQETVWLGDIPVATLRPGSPVRIFYVHTDHLNTPRKVTRPSDNRARWTWNSVPFGDALPDENPEGLGGFEYNLRFPGQIYDAHMELMYNYFRDYDPATGRYVESDPIGLHGGINTFSYAFANPLANGDPLGLRVLLVGHDAAEPLGKLTNPNSYHLALYLEPDSKCDCEGSWPLTLGAQKSGDRLVSAINYYGDAIANATFTQTVPTPSGMTDCEFIQNLIFAGARYDSKLPYSIPEIGVIPFVRDGYMPKGSYNSNSYVSGVLRRAGAALPGLNTRGRFQAPGYLNPIPL
jgi:RHS repeat-associated protein